MLLSGQSKFIVGAWRLKRHCSCGFAHPQVVGWQRRTSVPLTSTSGTQPPKDSVVKSAPLGNQVPVLKKKTKNKKTIYES